MQAKSIKGKSPEEIKKVLQNSLEELKDARSELATKNRELEIETALERVRAVAMSMKEPADMLSVCKIISLQLQSLGVKEIRNVQTAIFYVSRGIYMNYKYYAKHRKTIITETSYTNHKMHKAFAAKMLKGKGEFFITHIKGKKVKDWIAYQKTTNVFIDRFLEKADSLSYYWHSLGPVALGISTYVPLRKDELKLFQRFLNVFELAYTRYLDIEQALVQAKEARIELALERVRARAMAMQHSNELMDAASLLFQQVSELGVTLWGCGFNIWENDEKTCTSWNANPHGEIISSWKIPLTEDPCFIHFYESRQRGDILYVDEMGGEQLEATYRYMRKSPVIGEQIESIFKAGFTLPTFQINHLANFSHGNLLFITYEPVPEAHDIFIRFAKVFEQTYTRFLDLQKAEAQAREAKIEAALERVRSRSMGMQKSEELREVIQVIYEQLVHLGLQIDSAGFMMDYRETNDFDFWTADSYQSFPAKTHLAYFDHPVLNDFIAAKVKGLDFFDATYTAEEKNKMLDHITGIITTIPQESKEDTYSGSGLAISTVLMKNIALFMNNFSAIPHSEADNATLIRFAKVFEQTYTRFNDLIQAEAQARESQIEAALERVRSRSMGMQKSEELRDVIQVIYEQFVHLNIQINTVGFILDYKERDDLNFWIANKMGAPTKQQYPYFDSQHWNLFIEAKQKGLDFFADTLTFEEKNKFFQQIFGYTPGFPEEAKDFFYSNPGWASSNVLLKNVCLFIDNLDGIPFADADNATLMRFGKVFEQTYTRFLDLQKAEAQAREAQIELALERVRARTMAMHKSNDLLEVISVLAEQFQLLGFKIHSTNVNTNYRDKDWHLWIYNPGYTLYPDQLHIPYFDHPFFNRTLESLANGSDFNAFVFTKKEKDSYLDHIYANTIARSVSEERKRKAYCAPGYAWSVVYLKNTALTIANYDAEPYTEEQNAILRRFGNVFEQTYTRFLDLQKAEAQAREAKIEAALEKVRSRTMAMQRSTELRDAAALLFQQVQALGVPSFACGFNIWDDDRKAATAWMAQENVMQPPFKTPSTEDVFLPIHDAAQRGESLFVVEQAGKELEVHYKYMATIPIFKGIMKKMSQAGLSVPTFQIIHCAFFSQGYLMFISYERVPEAYDIFKRFAKVFEQTYTRFLDLQKAEAQARESQIQLALERVRARTMAMQKSDELTDAASLLFKQIADLGIKLWSTAFQIWNADDISTTAWPSAPDGSIQAPFRLPYNEDIFFKQIYEARQSGKDFFVMESSGKELEETYHYMFNLPGVKKYFDDAEDSGFQVPKFQITHCAFFSQGYVMFITYEPVPEAWDIFKRFGKVFEQTYTRFLDLQKAEAQAREAQIEAALERVRSRTMGMQRNDELAETASLLFKQVGELGTTPYGCGFNIWQPDEVSATAWMSMQDGSMHVPFTINYTGDIFFKRIYEARQSGKDFFVMESGGEELAQTYQYMFGDPEVKKRFEYALGLGIALPTFQITHCVFFAQGYLMFISYEPCPEMWDIFKRFGKVFEQTYTRFLDLQKAEAQARESQIEAALERVRSRTLAMQKSDELAETAAVLFQQLILLGIEPNRLYINIIKNETGEAEFWITDEDGSKVSSAFESNMNDNKSFKKMYKGWKEKMKSLMIDMKGKELEEYFQHLSRIHVPFKVGLTQKRRLQYIAYFNKGFIGMASPEEQPEETMLLLERFAAVFNLTFTRFNDLKIAEAHAIQAEEDLIKLQKEKNRAEEALTELQATQKQLIQSEKMASLGELTAGIAHEIQNPLNFVNNFSEVSSELLDEMITELGNDNKADAIAIADDVKQNLEKILHHGKRADGIVKGMLQHSRSSNGVKEPTDINALADEYLRLSYHGLRAKDKSFNATTKTDFDKSIGNINIIPQDIGRVILNLITNAFYAATEKKKQVGDSYEPTVSVSTKKINNKIEIRVADNGNGIPQKVLDKIFQPFFTTKPTGQGTGLGLSLAYDIIKAHGGEIKVDTKEGEGSEFIIQLPA